MRDRDGCTVYLWCLMSSHGTAVRSARRASGLLGRDAGELSAPGKSRSQSRLRYLVTTLAVERWRLTAAALGEVVGRRPDVVSRWVQRGVELRQDDDGFRAELERLDQAVARSFADAPT